MKATTTHFISGILMTLLVPVLGNAQAILWQQLADMPEPVANNAVAAATVNDVPFVYSFSGMDSTKSCNGDHLRAFRYNTQTEEWETIDPLPDPNGGKIAAAASTVKNKIYIIGGYHLSSTCNETSSNKVHIYDPETNTYLPDGADIPKAIDDQVQAVWRDSLIYVITGWSNFNNVIDVQIYNPAADQWLTGTPIPADSQWRVFGASGVIMEDTIYFAGGAGNWNGSNFPPTTTFRKGLINPNDPTEITWEGIPDPKAKGYRMGATSYQDKAIWIGGADKTYNFDGIAYDGSGGVPPLDRITIYDTEDGDLVQVDEVVPPRMDLRGVGKISGNQYIIAGGMEQGQEVSDGTFLLTINSLVGSAEVRGDELRVFPNPMDLSFTIKGEGQFLLEVYDINGKRIFQENADGGETVNIPRLSPATYLLKIWQDGQLVGTKKIVKQ